MKRLRRFWRNSDIRGSGAIRWVLLLVGLGFGTVHAVRSGSWVYLLPVLAATLLVTYLIRDWLVEHVAVVRAVMNAVLIVAVIVAMIPGAAEASESPWLEALIFGSLGTYLGCYFWLLSDERIEVPRLIRTR